MQEIFPKGTKKLEFGTMRLPLTDPNDMGSVDMELFKKMVDRYMEQGFTYFDTAWMYCDFKSENAVKAALVDRYPRDSFMLATKLHGGFISGPEGMDETFQEQLRKTGVSFFDYYLLHDMGDGMYDRCTKFGAFEWLKAKRDAGLVGHIGFSYHDNAELLDRILSEHPEMEFVQIQLNYLDWESEIIQSRKCYEVCEKYDKPVLVMEPVKGGTLANVPDKVRELFRAHDSAMSVPSWAVRFAASQPNVRMVLSGMSDLQMVEDNTSYMKEFVPLNAEELALVREAVELINANIAIPCTGCAYCTSGCPRNIAIPKYFNLYNAEQQEESVVGVKPQIEYYLRLINKFGKASDCIGCGKCEKICPQHLPIRKYLKQVAETFETPR